MNLLKKNGKFRTEACSRQTQRSAAIVAMRREEPPDRDILLSIGAEALENVEVNNEHAHYFAAEDLRELATELNRVADALDAQKED